MNVKLVVYSFLFILVLSCTYASAASNTYQAGQEAFNKHDYKKAATIFEGLAKKGNVKANYQMGTMYYFGIGVKEDNVKAVPYFEHAAKKGNTPSMEYLCEIYQIKTSKTFNLDKSIEWCKKAKAAGSTKVEKKLNNALKLKKPIILFGKKLVDLTRKDVQEYLTKQGAVSKHEPKLSGDDTFYFEDTYTRIHAVSIDYTDTRVRIVKFIDTRTDDLNKLKKSEDVLLQQLIDQLGTPDKTNNLDKSNPSDMKKTSKKITYYWNHLEAQVLLEEFDSGYSGYKLTYHVIGR